MIKPVADIYNEALRRLNGNITPLHFGGAHVVWEDGNFDSAEWCIEHLDEYKEGFSTTEMDVVRWSLVELAKIPVDDRFPDEPETALE